MKLIIDIPEDMLEWFKNGEIIDEYDKSALKQVFKNGTPLDNNSERAEVQAYFDGEAYGWEQGRKALIDDVKAEIQRTITASWYNGENYKKNYRDGLDDALEIINKYLADMRGET